jgi:hypothetical protein
VSSAEAKKRGDRSELPAEMAEEWKAAIGRAFDVLDAALVRSVLPDEAPNAAEVESWLIAVRLGPPGDASKGAALAAAQAWMTSTTSSGGPAHASREHHRPSSRASVRTPDELPSRMDGPGRICLRGPLPARRGGSTLPR